MSASDGNKGSLETDAGISSESMDVFGQPAMPAVWATIDEGETWVWDDYFLVLQEYPETVAVHSAREAGEPVPRQSMLFPNVLSVFYRYDKSLYGPSGKPVCLFMLEVPDVDSRDKYMGAKSADAFLSSLGKDGLRPDYRQVWADGRDDSRIYEGSFEQNSVRSFFFKEFKTIFKAKGVPRFQGALKDALIGQENEKGGKEYRPERLSSGDDDGEPKKKSSKWFYIAIVILVIIGFVLVTK
ncbi:MAG: hypothetical protein IKI30_08715 [Oxalobacter sp.]|nr:hypothetical protein [Oxalobacter sp.]